MRPTGCCVGALSDAQIYIWAVVILSGLATYVWRALGVAVAGKVSPDGEAFRLFTCIAYAMLAGLIARMIVLPAGVLAETPLSYRLIALGAAVAVFFLSRRNLALGAATGVAVFGALISVAG